jgi:hypothetical protein
LRLDCKIGWKGKGKTALFRFGPFANEAGRSGTTRISAAGCTTADSTRCANYYWRRRKIERLWRFGGDNWARSTGDRFLSVRGGPGGQPFRELDRLFNGNEVYICARSGPWLAVVYSDKRDLEQSCGVDKPWRTRQPYTGPCRYGWIHSTYVRIAEAKQEPRPPDSQPSPPVPGPPEPRGSPSPEAGDDQRDWPARMPMVAAPGSGRG